MATGDDAAAAGMALVSALTDEVRDGADHHNQTRDYIAQRTNAVTPIAKGGTGADNAAAARTNLGIPAIAAPNSAEAGKLPIYSAAAQLTTATPTLNGHAASKEYVDAGTASLNDNKRSLSDCDFGNFIVRSQNIRNFTVVSDYASVYASGAAGGYRLGIQPSAERFKQDITPHVYTLDQLMLIQVVAYRLRAAVQADPNAAGEVGVIAEQLIDAGLGEFVIYDEEGTTQSVAYERLHLVAIGAIQDMAGRLARLEQRLTALEGGAAS